MVDRAAEGGSFSVLFVGLGKMGWPMAMRLLEAGLPVRGLDANPDVTAKFSRENGALPALAPVEAARQATLVITMLPTSAIVRTVLLDGDNAIAPQLPKRAVVIDMSSGVPAVTAEIAKSLETLGIPMLDAPVSGGVSRAINGTLSIMAGGDAEVLGRVESVLSAMGKSVTHTGSIGSGQAMKALNNLVSAGGFLIGVEALLIGRKFGLDPDRMVDVLNMSTGRNNSTEAKFKQFVISRAFNSGFDMDLMSKDLGIALEIARETKTPTPFAALCQQMWQAATASLGNGLDHTEMARFTELLGGAAIASVDDNQKVENR